MFATINALTPYWLLIFGGAFFVLEGYAIFVDKKKGKSGGTLSALVWRFIDWKKSPGHRVARVGFAIFWLLLSSHFFFGTPLIPGVL